MKRLLDDWINGLWEFVVLAICFLLLAACLGGCWSSDTQTREQTRTTIGPIVAETPVGTISIQQVPIQQERQMTEQTKTTVDLPPVGMIAPLIPGGAAAGGLMGLAGAAFGAWRMLRERAANKALSQTAAGIEDFKAGLQPEIIESLHNSLGRSMDSHAKKLVKQAKAQV